MANMSLESPTKASKHLAKILIDDKEGSTSPDTVNNELPEDIEELRKMFVGEVDLPECESS